MGRTTIAVLALLVLLLAACAGAPAAPDGAAPAGDAAELPEQAQTYVEMSREALAEELGVAPDEIELDSITTPPEEEGVYLVRLEAGGQVYEYHGRDGEVLRVSEPLPLAPSDGGSPQ